MPRAEQPCFFAIPQGEEQRPLGRLRQLLHGIEHFQKSRDAAGVVVGPVMDVAPGAEAVVGPPIADMIVVGRVESIRAPTFMAAPHRRITEHDADWQEAVIVVDSMVKGPASIARVAVRFPASRDIAWHRFPKFTTGQAGTFLLRRDTLTGSPQARVAGRTVPAYNVVAGSDVLGTGDAARVRALVKP